MLQKTEVTYVHESLFSARKECVKSSHKWSQVVTAGVFIIPVINTLSIYPGSHVNQEWTDSVSQNPKHQMFIFSETVDSLNVHICHTTYKFLFRV